ncbi:MAG: hypothetical protein JW820_01745 [Spirochaetales bacterium]|nr:hypothetical protein [Spirochaetales bacterium]
MGRTFLFAFLILAGFLVLYLMLKRRIDARTDSRAVLGEIRDEIDRIIVELNQTTERNITLIEDRLAALSDQLGQADRKISLLRREGDKTEASTQLYANLLQRRAGQDEPKEQEPKEQDVQEQDVQEQVLRLHHSGVSPAAIARRVGKPLAEIDLIISLSARRR